MERAIKEITSQQRERITDIRSAAAASSRAAVAASAAIAAIAMTKVCACTHGTARCMPASWPAAALLLRGHRTAQPRHVVVHCTRLACCVVQCTALTCRVLCMAPTLTHAHQASPTCTPGFSHMHTRLLSHAHQASSTCTPGFSHMHTRLLSHAHQASSTCTPGFSHMHTWLSL